MPPVFTRAVGAVLLGSRVCAVGLSHVEMRLGAIARQPEVGLVQNGQQLTAIDAIAFGLENAHDARRDLGNDRHLGPRIERACQRQRLDQIAGLNGRGAYGNRADRFHRRRLSFRFTRAGCGTDGDRNSKEIGFRVHCLGSIRLL